MALEQVQFTSKVAPYNAGEIAAFEPDVAAALVERGDAIKVQEPEPEPEPEEKEVNTTKTRTKPAKRKTKSM